MHADAGWLPSNPPSTSTEETSNKGPFFLAIAATLVSIALLIFLLRVITRIRLLRFFGIDDWFMFIALLCSLGTLVIFAQLIWHGQGRDTDVILHKDATATGRYFWSFSLIFVIGISFVKLSLVFFLLRIIHQTCYRRILYIMIGLLIPFTVTWFSTIIFQCIPITAAWNPPQSHRAHCISPMVYKNVGLLNGSAYVPQNPKDLVLIRIAIDITTALVLATIPLPMVWKLQIGLRTKISLIAVFSLGFISCAAAIVRTSLQYKMWDSDVPFAHGAWLCIWSVIEMTTGIAAACLPSLKPLFNTVSKFLSSLNPLNPARQRSTKPESSAESPPPSPYPQSYSTPTFLSLPRPKPVRFHDHTSDLDFDLFTTPTRTRTHSRNPSNLTIFSNFTNFTTHGHVEGEDPRPTSRARTCSKGLGELEGEMKEFRNGYAVSITSGSGETCDGSEESTTIRRMASDEESVRRLERIGKEEASGGILRTTEVTIS